MKRFKKILFRILAVMVAFFLFLVWYQYKYSMDVVTPYNINSPTLDKKLLIATQGSDFKDKVTSDIVDHFKSDSVYIEVVDVESLNDIDPNNFNALVIIHTWENWKPPLSVQSFIDKYGNESNKIIVFTTSGDGDNTMEGVDAIAGESKLSEAPLFINRIIDRLNKLLM
ncbi:hypothetical protein [Maribacter stanieri]|uniref:Flavodoxin n=1 Tax=Maribacter stanieri TaxID=440514 RepID=A0A1I6IIQ6_9FLAO|nr:hypothetical protein [Maribacter stanieri]SFR66583.1 hypothetical protein SAMN04488010_1794 [Maribacter stanieri]